MKWCHKSLQSKILGMMLSVKYEFYIGIISLLASKEINLQVLCNYLIKIRYS